MSAARQRTRTRPAHAVLAAFVLLTLTIASTPTVAAQSETFDPRLDNCSNAQCIVEALLGGLVRLVGSFFIGVASIIGGVGTGIANLVIRPFLMMFEGFFGGMGAGLQALGLSFFSGAGDSFSRGYQELSNSLVWFGPLAPLVVLSVAIAAAWLLFLFATKVLFPAAIDLLPEQAEEVLKSQDDQSED